MTQERFIEFIEDKVIPTVKFFSESDYLYNSDRSIIVSWGFHNDENHYCDYGDKVIHQLVDEPGSSAFRIFFVRPDVKVVDVKYPNLMFHRINGGLTMISDQRYDNLKPHILYNSDMEEEIEEGHVHGFVVNHFRYSQYKFK
jgi:hypothetical protein